MEEKCSLQTCRIHASILQLQHQRQALNDALLLSGLGGWIQATLLHLDCDVKQVIITFTPEEDTHRYSLMDLSYFFVSTLKYMIL